MKLARIGLLAPPAAGLLWTIGLAVRGPLLDPSDPDWANWAASGAFRTFTSMALNATVWLAFGAIALQHRFDSKAGRFGGAFLLAGCCVLLAPLGAIAFTWPTSDATAAYGALEHPTAVVWWSFAKLSFALGAGILGYAMLPTYRIAGAFVAFGGILWMATLNLHAAPTLGAALFTLGAAAPAWRAWKPKPVPIG